MVVKEPPGFLIERLEKRDLPFGCAIFKEGGNSTKTGASAQSVVDNSAVSLDVVFRQIPRGSDTSPPGEGGDVMSAKSCKFFLTTTSVHSVGNYGT